MIVACSLCGKDFDTELFPKHYGDNPREICIDCAEKAIIEYMRSDIKKVDMFIKSSLGEDSYKEYKKKLGEK